MPTAAKRTLRGFPPRLPSAENGYLCAALFLLAAPGVLVASAGAHPDVFFFGEPYCAHNVGDRFTAFLWLDTGGDSVSCFHLYLTYDRTRLDLISAAEGDFFANSGHPTLFIWEDEEADTTGFTGCLLGQGTFVTGMGEIVRLEFELLDCPGPAESALDLTEYRAQPPPFQISFVLDQDRQVLQGVEFFDASTKLCEECATAGVPGAAAPGAGGRLDVSPNPAGNQVRIAWNLGGGDAAGSTLAEPLLFELLDVTGRRLKAQIVTGGKRGSLEWSLSAGGARLPGGVYWLALRPADADGPRLARKFTHVE